MKKIKLFCIPYAGGSAAVYNKWKQYSNGNIEICPIELAGRGKRIHEPLYDSIEEAIDDVFNIIKNDLNNEPYGFFGHSMGGIIVYELSHKIINEKLPEPIHIFFSGRGAPHVPADDDKKIYHTMPEDEFKKEVIDLGGTPEEFFDHPELLEVLLPILKNDFKITETYKHNGKINPFDYDITVFVGKDEEVNADQMFGWRDCTKEICTIHYFEGEHFFLNNKIERIVNIINYTLNKKI